MIGPMIKNNGIDKKSVHNVFFRCHTLMKNQKNSPLQGVY